MARTFRISAQTGSSPLAWGTPLFLHFYRHRLRFIPTRVGNTLVVSSSSWNHPVHPHSRGEHLFVGKTIEHWDGSSPLAWGTQHIAVCQNPDGRFIPTRVGNTLGRQARSSSAPVHPHSRGEHSFFRTSILPSTGSSPLAWGTLGNGFPFQG